MNFFEEIVKIDVPIIDFGVYSESDDVTPATDYYIGEVYSLARKLNITVTEHWGASQLAFVIEGEKEVVKVPFAGMMEEWSDWDPTTDEYEDHEEFSNFEVNYTALTEQIYAKAVSAGVGMFFAKIEKIGKNIWKQEYVEPRSKQSTSKKPSDDSCKKAEAMKREFPFENDWAATAIDMYGLDKFKELLQFIRDEKLSDFHWNNYGWGLDGQPLLLDYCGFSC